MNGRLIVIEGLDGSGKSTQLDLLKKVLSGFSYLTFPNYDSDSGKIIKQYLNNDFGETCAYSASSFYAVDRYINYKKSWEAQYKSGTDFISARYTTSNAIYQMAKLPESEWVKYIHWLYDYEYVKLALPVPDMTIFLDVPLAVSQKLLDERYMGGFGGKDIHEGDVAYLEKCRLAAAFAAKRDGWVKINCMRDGVLRAADDVNSELVACINAHI